jgi:ParB-like chromosome segregation protein Spo0J
MTPPPVVKKVHKVVPIDTVQPFPGNARIGNRAGIMESLHENGQFDSLIVQKSTGYIIAGNNTWHAAKEAGMPTISVDYIDVDDERAKRMNLVHNKLNDQAGYDERLLLEMLSDLDTLEGTGYELGDLEALAKSLDSPDLDELADALGDPAHDDGWHSINVRVPHQVMGAWNAHVAQFEKRAAQAMANLLGVDWEKIDTNG